MRVLLATLLIACASMAHAVNLDVRHFYITNNIASARSAVTPLRWYQGESVNMDLYVRRGTTAVDLSGAGLFPRWESFLDSDLTTAYVMSTGTVADATNGYVTFSLPITSANLPTNSYTTYIKLYQPVDGTNTYVGTVLKARSDVYWSPSATNFVYQGPYTNSVERDPVWLAWSTGAYATTTNTLTLQIQSNDTDIAALQTATNNLTSDLATHEGLNADAAHGETDPIWAAVSNTVTTGAALGATALQAYTETDPIWAAVSNTVTTGAALGATALQAYTETDPIWGAVSNTVTTGAAAGATALQAESDPVYTVWVTNTVASTTNAIVDGVLTDIGSALGGGGGAGITNTAGTAITHAITDGTAESSSITEVYTADAVETAIALRGGGGATAPAKTRVSVFATGPRSAVTNDAIGLVTDVDDLDSTSASSDVTYYSFVTTDEATQETYAFQKPNIPIGCTSITNIRLLVKQTQVTTEPLVLAIRGQRLSDGVSGAHVVTCAVDTAGIDKIIDIPTAGTFFTNDLSGSIIWARWTASFSSTNSIVPAYRGFSDFWEFWQ